MKTELKLPVSQPFAAYTELLTSWADTKVLKSGHDTVWACVRRHELASSLVLKRMYGEEPPAPLLHDFATCFDEQFLRAEEPTDNDAVYAAACRLFNALEDFVLALDPPKHAAGLHPKWKPRQHVDASKYELRRYDGLRADAVYVNAVRRLSNKLAAHVETTDGPTRDYCVRAHATYFAWLQDELKCSDLGDASAFHKYLEFATLKQLQETDNFLAKQLSVHVEVALQKCAKMYIRRQWKVGVLKGKHTTGREL
jgi:hypothetical protein